MISNLLNGAVVLLICAVVGGIVGLPIAYLIFKIQTKKAHDVPTKLIQEVKNATKEKDIERDKWRELYSEQPGESSGRIEEGESREGITPSPVELDGDKEDDLGRGGIPVPVYKGTDKPRKKFKLHRPTDI